MLDCFLKIWLAKKLTWAIIQLNCPSYYIIKLSVVLHISVSGVGIGIGVERQNTIWRQDFTVGENGMEYGEVKTDPDSDTDSNPD